MQRGELGKRKAVVLQRERTLLAERRNRDGERKQCFGIMQEKHPPKTIDGEIWRN